MKKLLYVLLPLSLFFMANECSAPSTSQMQEQTRDQIMDRANQQVPTPIINNFITRSTVAKWMERMDDPSKVFYVYVYAEQHLIGYYTASTYPVNFNTFLTPPDRVERTGSSSVSRVVRQAPGADGVYYGSSGSETYYFFDAETDAMVQITGMHLFVSDQPLELDTEPIQVRAVD